MEGTMRCSANYVPLSPISFLERAAVVYGDRPAIIYDSVEYPWEQTARRCHRLASALVGLGVSRWDVVAALGPNIPALIELHYAAPMAGALISLLSTSYDAALLSHLLGKVKPKLFFVDHQYLDLANRALHLLSEDGLQPPLIITIADTRQLPVNLDSSFNPDNLDYETILNSGNPEIPVQWPEDEFNPISICYTSGTTGTPKPLVHNHRAAYLNSIATILLMEMAPNPVFLWTVPLHHCNGWSFVWAVAALGGTNVCLRNVMPEAIHRKIVEHKVNYLAGTTPILNMILSGFGNHPPPTHAVSVLAGGAPPPPDILAKMERLGFRVTHAGGQTETYCAAIYCLWRPEWNKLPAEERAKLRARQGIQHLILADVDVKDPVTMESLPADGETAGELVYRGNNIMSGYLDPVLTKAAFRGGWFHSGDLAVMHPDGYVEIKDRLNDAVEAGGGRFGTIEIEAVFYGHPAVEMAAVVGVPGGGESGEVLCAFVQLKKSSGAVTGEEMIEFCRAQLPESVVPSAVIFDEIPITVTGKIKKYVLREKARAAAANASLVN